MIGRLKICLLLVPGLLVACGGLEQRDGPGQARKASRAEKVVPKKEPLSKYGNPESYVVFGKRYYTLKSAAGFKERGIASWYGKKFHGRKTSSGEVYDMYKMTAAHKNLPLPTYVEVRNLDSNKVITVRVNDRGPFHAGRIIDLSYAAAQKLGIVANGTGRVEIRVVDGSAGTTYAENSSRQGAPVSTRGGETITETVAKAAVDNAVAVVQNETNLDPVVVERARDVATNYVAEKMAETYLQIGAYRDLVNAENALEKIRRHIPFARIQQGDSTDPAVYRVQIGPLINSEDIAQYVTQLTSLGFADHHFVTSNSP
ncbi:MAG: septal ring lytic transglycosylase RlpA family protein [Pseudomonadota bacterium]